MVVPYIRNPRRHRNAPVVIKPKSQYHLEPDHASLYEEVSISGVGRVGRRTKGGSGGGYLYSSSSSQYRSNGSGNGSECTSKACKQVSTIIGYTVFGIFGLIIGVGILISITRLIGNTYRDLQKCFQKSKQIVQERQRRREAVRRLEEQAETQYPVARAVMATAYPGTDEDIESSIDPAAPHIATVQASSIIATTEGSNMEEILKDMDRLRLIRSKLHYQVVLPDKSNITAQSIRGNNLNVTTDIAKTDDAATEASFDDDDEDDDSVIEADETKALSGRKPAAKKKSSSSSSSSYFTLRNFLSFRPIQHDDCSICLECFSGCQTICVAKNSCCDHVFHEACLESWLMSHDHCPKCNCNIMIE